ncbi:MAG TPA: amino acid adenylation domain-containing protein [Cellvibrio sp.]|nr:amino acid adenylation domain-containing protein [Cellvibrio sp.]
MDENTLNAVPFLSLFDRHAQTHPQRIALAGDSASLTYVQLHTQAEIIAARLQAMNIPASSVVAIHTESCALAIAAMIAVLRSGCAYLPLDPVYPAERLNYMVANADTRLVISDNDAFVPESCRILNLREVDFNAPLNAVAQHPAIVESGDAYIIYTSGSTGRPKGVRMNHGTLNNLIRWQNAHYSAAEAYRTLQFSSLSFDVSFQEIFATFAQGGCLFLVANQTKQDFRALLNFIDDHKIERIFLPYIALLQLLQWANRLQVYPQSLREIITAGEQLVVSDDLKKAFKALPSARLHNQYGPSESHVVTEYSLPEEIDQWENIPPIGKPIDKAEILLLDEQQQPVAEGEVGELYISGPVLANGYINNPEETAKRFIELQFNGKSHRSYRTGDLAARDSSGNILYKGRVDSQVKISGYRVELSEVEAHLLNTGLVEEAAVAVRELRGNKSLVAFICVKSPADFALASLKSRIEGDLPQYMIPGEFHLLPQLVKTPTGKIDRKTMLENLAKNEAVAAVVPQNTNQQILAIIRREIHRPEARLQDNLLDQGMDSLAANRIAAALYDELSITVPTYALFQHRSIKLFIDYINKTHKSGDQSAASAVRADKSADAEVAIIGMALKVPGANRLDEFWDNLAAGRESVHFFADTTADGEVNARGIIDDPLGFDEGFFEITPMEARFIDPQQRVLLELTWHALENAGYVASEFPGRIGIFCGTGNNSYYLNNVLQNQKQLQSFSPFQAMIANEKDYCATRIAYKLNLVGPALSIHSACSTSLVAVCNAVEAIRSGQCDIAIAGGASVTFPQQQPYEYQEGSIYSRDGHTRTFDKDSSGTVFSDGAGLVVLKRLDYAQADGDHIYAAISGVAVNNDGADKGSFSAPSVEGQKHVIMAAQQNAGVAPQAIGYIEAHGTATPIGDPIEVAALTAAFGGAAGPRQTCRLGSVKSNFGHLTAAAGVVGLIKSALAIERDLIPATLNFSEANPALNIHNTPFQIASKAAPWGKALGERIAGISSFGIGGTNAHAVIRGVQSAAAELIDLPKWLPLCISAASATALSAYLGRYQDYLQQNPKLDSASLALYLARHRAHLKYRKALAADTSKALSSLFNVRVDDAEPVPLIENIALAFPGQGSQVAGMGAELYASVESFRNAFDLCAEIAARNHQVDLKALILSGEGDISETRNTQLALFTTCYCLAQALADLGVQAQAAIGHSIGELAAAVVAGVFDLETGLRIVLVRGTAMQAQERGAMVAVREPASALSAYINDKVVLAAQNTPESCTLAGSHQAIDSLCEQLTARGIKFKKLQTSHAFHSPSMEAAKVELARQLAEVKLSAPQIPFISCVTGDWIRPEQATDIHYWAEQLRQPVKFYQGINTLASLPNLLVIECGPQRTVAGMVLQTLSEKTDLHLVHLLSAAGESGRELSSFSQAIGQLWELGLELQWPTAELNRQCFKDLPNYPFQHNTHLIEPDIQARSTAPALIDPIPLANQHTAVITMKDTIISQLEGLFSDISGMDLHNADRAASFFELGLDSLLLTQSTIKLKKQFKVQVTFRQLLNDCNNFSALADYLANNGVVVDAPAAAPAPAPVAAVAAAPQALASVPATILAQPQWSAPVASLPPIAAADGSVIALLQQQMQLLQGQLALLTSYSGGAAPQTLAAAPQVVASVAAVAAAPAAEKSVKPFGAGTRINVKRSNELTPQQKANLDKLSERYNKKFKSSKQFAQDNRKQLADPRVVSGFRNSLKEIIYPIVVAKSEGAYLWDIDGFRMIDITCGFGSNFFGNSAPFIKEAIAKQLDIGYEIGPQHPLMADAARLFCEITGNERAAFCNTGSEAVLGAIRLARTVTAKEKIVMFENDYHGINDEVIVTRGSNGFAAPAAAGIPDAAVENVIMLDYGDEKSLEYIIENADEIAGLLIEPVQSRYPELQPREFLQKARKICSEKNIALIFDEVITGFRIHPRGAQGHYGIDADICTYGKIVGGGLPVGVISGKKEYMDALDGGQWQYGDNSAPEVGVTYFAGTFVRHPLVLAAAVAVLSKMKAEPDLQKQLNARADRMVKEINDYAKLVGAPLKIANCGSMCKIKIPQEIAYEELIYIMLREKGIHVWDARPTFITTAHSDADIEFIINAFKEAMDEMLLMEFFPAAESKTSAASASAAESDYQKQHFTPPVPGAKLGRDEEGRAVWYVPSAKDPSQFERWQG